MTYTRQRGWFVHYEGCGIIWSPTDLATSATRLCVALILVLVVERSRLSVVEEAAPCSTHELTVSDMSRTSNTRRDSMCAKGQ